MRHHQLLPHHYSIYFFTNGITLQVSSFLHISNWIMLQTSSKPLANPLLSSDFPKSIRYSTPQIFTNRIRCGSHILINRSRSSIGVAAMTLCEIIGTVRIIITLFLQFLQGKKISFIFLDCDAATHTFIIIIWILPYRVTTPLFSCASSQYILMYLLASGVDSV